MPPAETIKEAFRDTSALPTSLLMGWLLASSLYKRDIDEERIKSKREKEKVKEDVAQLENEIQQLQEENQYVVAKCKEVAEQVITQCDEENQEVVAICDEEKQELLKRLHQTRNAGKNWIERVREVVTEDNLTASKPPVGFDKNFTQMEMPENNCSVEKYAKTLESLTTREQIKGYTSTFLIEFSMNCQTSEFKHGISEIKRLQKQRLAMI